MTEHGQNVVKYRNNQVRTLLFLWSIGYCLLASPCTCAKELVFLLYVHSSSVSFFSSQYPSLLLRFSPSPSYVSVISPSMTSLKMQILLRICPIQFFLRNTYILIRSVFFFLYTFKNPFSLAILSPPLSSSTKFRSSPNTSAPIFLILRSPSHVMQCSKYNRRLISSWVRCLACLSRVIIFFSWLFIWPWWLSSWVRTYCVIILYQNKIPQKSWESNPGHLDH